MKKIAILLAALMLMLPLAACGSKKPSGQIAPTFKPSHIGPEIETGSAHGKLYFAAIEDDFTVTAMQISGNRAGSAEFNAREPALSDIRSVFELNEWIEVVLSFNTPVGGGKEGDMYVCAHRDFAEYSPENLRALCGN